LNLSVGTSYCFVNMVPWSLHPWCNLLPFYCACTLCFPSAFPGIPRHFPALPRNSPQAPCFGGGRTSFTTRKQPAGGALCSGTR
jgi:hypothetical protein